MHTAVQYSVLYESRKGSKRSRAHESPRVGVAERTPRQHAECHAVGRALHVAAHFGQIA